MRFKELLSEHDIALLNFVDGYHIYIYIYIYIYI